VRKVLLLVLALNCFTCSNDVCASDRSTALPAPVTPGQAAVRILGGSAAPWAGFLVQDETLRRLLLDREDLRAAREETEALRRKVTLLEEELEDVRRGNAIRSEIMELRDASIRSCEQGLFRAQDAFRNLAEEERAVRRQLTTLERKASRRITFGDLHLGGGGCYGLTSQEPDLCLYAGTGLTFRWRH